MICIYQTSLSKDGKTEVTACNEDMCRSLSLVLPDQLGESMATESGCVVTEESQAGTSTSVAACTLVDIEVPMGSGTATSLVSQPQQRWM